MAPSSLRRALLGAAAALPLWLPGAEASAHGQEPAAGEGSIAPVLDALPPPLADLRVQVHRSLAPQLLLENPGEQALEVLDERGAPFLRIGPDGVEANLASPAWYRTASPSDAVPVPREVAAAGAAGETLPPRWRRVGAEPAWGWFDRRIEVDALEPPHAAARAGRRAEVGRWEVPVRLGGTRSALRGRFVHVPAARGALRLRLTGEREIAPGVVVSVLAGRGGSFFLRSDSPEIVTLIGSEGEPFLRFSPEGVEANRTSPTFAEVVRLRGGRRLVLEQAAATAPVWTRVSSIPRYAWVDPRPFVDVPADVEVAGERVELASWSLPVRIGSGEGARSAEIRGATWWQPLPVERTEARPAASPQQEKP